MKKNVLVLTVSAALTCVAVPALAQGQLQTVPSGQPQSHHSQSSELTGQGGSMPERGMRGMMDREGAGAMGRRGMMGPGARQQDAPIHSMMMRMIFALIDADGDGALSLQEFQAAHERIFKAMDSNKDGRLSFEEMENFMHGSTRPAPVR
jgi:EF hand